MKAKTGEGEGVIISLNFDLTRDIERKAHKTSQRLARRRKGARKDVIIAFLAALDDYMDMVGIEMGAEELAGVFLKNMISGGSAAPASTRFVETKDKSLIVETAGGVSVDDIAANFIGSQIDDNW